MDMIGDSKRRDFTKNSSSNVELKRRKLRRPVVTHIAKQSAIKPARNEATNKSPMEFQVNIPEHLLPQSPSPPSPPRERQRINSYILQSPQSPQSLQEMAESRQGKSSDTPAISTSPNIPKPSTQQPKSLESSSSSKSSKTKKYERSLLDVASKFSKVGKENIPPNQHQKHKKSVMLNEQASIFSKRNSKSTAIFTTKPRSKFKVYVDDSSQDDNLFVPKSFTDKYRSLAERSNSTDDIRKDIYNNDSNQVYITNLPNECLYYIFMLCDDLSTKCNITQVCKKWRLLMLNSSNWKNATTSLVDFQHYITSLKNEKKARYSYQHIQKLTTLYINHLMSEHMLSHSSMSFPKSMPFNRLSSLKLDHLFYSDLLCVHGWIGPVIRRLECRNIRFGDSKYVCLDNFLCLPRLRVLILEFQQRCTHVQSRMFNISGRPVHMSKNNIQLKALSFLNYHDTEEYSTPTMDAWYDMERVLYLKYIAFSTMSELKSLALSRCNAFTASIWRDCFLPCAPRLKRLYLAGWEGRGFRQSPQALLERRAHEEWAGVARIPDEVELALAEFISSLVSIKSIHLNDFYCGHGLVLGLERLNRPYKLCADESGVIDSYINTRLNHFKIIFIYSKT